MNESEGKMTKSIITVACGSILAVALFLSACSTSVSPTTSPTETDENIPGMPNPAAMYCEGLGYSMENVTREGGEDADCIFPDESRCAQWDFLAGRCGDEFTYCEKQGSTIEEGGSIGTCRFPDNSTCNEFQYFSGECSPGDNPGATGEESLQIEGVPEARDYIAAYFYEHYGIEQTEPWSEQDVTPDDAVGSIMTRFVSGPLTIVISVPAAAPSPTEYVIEEASYIANGFFWEGMVSNEGEITESFVIPPASILNPEDARDAVMEYINATYKFASPGDWMDQGVSEGDAGTALRVYTSGPWVVEVEFTPAAPLVPSYRLTVDNVSEGIRWVGDITNHGDIMEISFTE